MKPGFPAFGLGSAPTPIPAPAPATRAPALAGVASPCINVCSMNAATGLCEGCLRTLDEIALWSQLEDGDKRDVLALIELRRNDAPDPFGP